MGEYPDHRPNVLAKLAWDDNSLYIIFRVEDRYVRAVAKKYQDQVCLDSCVELFFTPGSNLGFSYFDIEINCGGTMLFWWHPEGKKAVPVAAKDGERIEVGRTLSKIVDPEIEEPPHGPLTRWGYSYTFLVHPCYGEAYSAGWPKCQHKGGRESGDHSC